MRSFYVLILSLCLFLIPSLAFADEPMLIRAGGSFGYARSSDGTIWAWGDNARGQLGTGNTVRARTPQAGAYGIDGQKVADIACGNVAALFLMKDGSVYTCGANNYGQQGQGNNVSVVKLPVMIPGLEHITKIACGFGQCLALDEDGHVWAWGRNSNGQIGNGNKKSQSSPVLLSLENIIDIQCGGKFCMAMDAQGQIYGWGDNEFGQLLDASRGANILNPTLLSVSGQFVKIACGGDIAFGIDHEGTLWSWGRNDYLQLGNNTVKGRTSTPVKVLFPESVVITDVLAYNAHSAAITDQGALWQWGSVYHGQMGIGKQPSRSLPLQASPAEHVFGSAVGSLQSYVLLDDGSLYGAGCNEYSQTGAFKHRTDYYVLSWMDTGLNLMTGEWKDPQND